MQILRKSYAERSQQCANCTKYAQWRVPGKNRCFGQLCDACMAELIKGPMKYWNIYKEVLESMNVRV